MPSLLHPRGEEKSATETEAVFETPFGALILCLRFQVTIPSFPSRPLLGASGTQIRRELPELAISLTPGER